MATNPSRHAQLALLLLLPRSSAAGNLAVFKRCEASVKHGLLYYFARRVAHGGHVSHIVGFANLASMALSSRRRLLVRMFSPFSRIAASFAWRVAGVSAWTNVTVHDASAPSSPSGGNATSSRSR